MTSLAPSFAPPPAQIENLRSMTMLGGFGAVVLMAVLVIMGYCHHDRRRGDLSWSGRGARQAADGAIAGWRRGSRRSWSRTAIMSAGQQVIQLDDLCCTH